MYLAHFQLKKEPFGIAPDAEFLWIGPQHAHVLKILTEGVCDRDGCVVLTGDIGTGKSVLVKRMVARSDLAPVFITVSGPELDGLEFYHVLAAEFHMNRRFESREAFIAAFTQVLSQAFGAHQKLLLVIEEAQRLTQEALRDLVVLGTLQSEGKRLLKILLVGQIDFNADALLEMHGGDQANLAARCSLEPLTEGDTQSYIAHRLKTAGREQPLFSADAVRLIHALSKGYPRLINIICDHALLYGYSANLALINGGVIRECSRDLSVALDLPDVPDDQAPETADEGAAESTPAQDPHPFLTRWRSWLYFAAAVMTAGLALYLTIR